MKKIGPSNKYSPYITAQSYFPEVLWQGVFYLIFSEL